MTETRARLIARVDARFVALLERRYPGTRWHIERGNTEPEDEEDR